MNALLDITIRSCPLMFGEGDVCTGCLRPFPFCRTGTCPPSPARAKAAQRGGGRTTLAGVAELRL